MDAPKSDTRMDRVLSFATLTAAGFVLGKLSGILREIVVSAHFGLSAELDAYFVAFTVPTIINNVVAGGTITAAMMPTLVRYLANDERAEFWRVASLVTNIVLLVTGIITCIVMFLPAPVIELVGTGFAEPTKKLAAELLVIMMPTLMLGALLNMLMAMLNSLDRFVAPALIFLALNAGIIVTVILLSPMLGVAAVAWGFLIGVTLQVVVQFIELRLEHPRFYWRIDWRHPALRQVWRAFVPITALSVVAQINYVIDKVMATTLPAGSVGALYYADSVLGLFSMIGISLGIGVFPSLSRLVAENDLASAGRAVTQSLRLLIFVLTPMTILLIPFALPLVGLILGRGKFDASAVDLTAQAMVMYALGLIAIAAINILQRAFFALADSVTPLVIGLATMILHVGLNLVLIPWLSHAGIALSASISASLGALVLIGMFARRVSHLEPRALLIFLGQCGVLAVFSTVVVAWFWANLSIDVATMWGRMMGVGLAASAVLVYFVLALVWRLPESRWLVNWAVGLLRQRRVNNAQ